MKRLLLTLLFIPMYIFADTSNEHFVSRLPERTCDNFFQSYAIDPKIKSVTGWKRVIYQKKLTLYFPEVPIYKKGILSECLITSGLDLKQFNRSIGGKK